MAFLDSKPTPEEELADEIKAYEEEQAKSQETAEAEPDDVQPVESVDDVSRETKGEQGEETSEQTTNVETEEAETEPVQEKQVPLKALQESRADNQQLRSELAELRGQLGAFMQLQQQAVPNQQQAEAPPDPEEDPIGALQWMKGQMGQYSQHMQAMYQHQQQQAQNAQLQQMVWRHRQEFEQQHPDYQEAQNFLVESRVAELRAQGLDDNQIAVNMQNEERAIAVSALQQNINPAARVYEIAKARGWNPDARPKPNGQDQKAKAAAVDPALEERKKNAATNVSRTSPPKGEVGVEEALKLSGAAFDSWWEKNMPKDRTFS